MAGAVDTNNGWRRVHKQRQRLFFVTSPTCIEMVCEDTNHGLRSNDPSTSLRVTMTNDQ
nr:hypothetical protein [Bacteroidota bacterium]